MSDQPATLPRPRRRPPRFTVRGLMFLIVVIAAVLGLKHHGDVQREAVAAISRGGGIAGYDYQIMKTSEGPMVWANAKPKWPPWLFDRLGPEFLATVEQVDVGPLEPERVMVHVGRLHGLRRLRFASRVRLTDADMVHLRGLARLEELRLAGPGITGASLVNLKGMTRLRILHLPRRRMRITDANLAALSGLKALNGLDLSFNRGITDAGLVHLEPLVNLERLSLKRTSVTGAGLVHLRGMTKLADLDLSETRADTLAPIRHLTQLSGLNLDDTPILDDGLAPVSELQQLGWLSLGHSRAELEAEPENPANLRGLIQHLFARPIAKPSITDAGLAHIAKLPRLHVLHLFGTQATDAGLVGLLKCTKLADLELGGPGITDAGLLQLAKLKNLRDLTIRRRTNVTDEGIAALRRARPDLSIMHLP